MNAHNTYLVRTMRMRRSIFCRRGGPSRSNTLVSHNLSHHQPLSARQFNLSLHLPTDPQPLRKLANESSQQQPRCLRACN